MKTASAVKRMAVMLALCSPVTLLAGCPYLPTDTEYDAGFDEGFLQDDWYWAGFDDSYYTVDGGAIYYQGSDIPYYDDGSYDAGYYDGVWYAYNDGYFVEYDYAFTIGFSEGYDAAFANDWPWFIAEDEHVEWLDGGFTDGYNDGFSEGRIFGAYDYETGLAFDWLDAMLDYRDGTDLTVTDANNTVVGTGTYGPVYLYEYGTDPNDLVKSAVTTARLAGHAVPAIRNTDAAKADIPALSYRDLPTQQQGYLNVIPATSPRASRALTLDTSWLDRVNSYRTALSGAKAGHQHRVQNR